MFKVICVVFFSSVVCIAGSDLSSLTIFPQLPELYGPHDKPVMETVSDQPDTPELTCFPLERHSAEYTAVPRQELPCIDKIALSTSDMPDSDDSFFVQSSPRTLPTEKQD